LALFDMFLIYDWPCLHLCIPQENSLFSTLIVGSFFSDYVVFYGDISFILSSAIWVQVLTIHDIGVTWLFFTIGL